MNYEEGIKYLSDILTVVQKSLIPLYYWDNNKRFPQFNGTSLYINLGIYGLIFTASHVLDDIYPKKPMYPKDKHIFIELPCDGVRKHENDEFDIGVIELKERLKSWNSFNIENIDKYKDSKGFQHFLVGYTASSAKRSNREKQKIEVKGYLTSGADEKEYIRLKKNKDNFALLKFQKEKVFNEDHDMVNFPNPNGMSGGIILQIEELNPKNVKLVGIMNEWDTKQKNVIIATKIEKYFELFSSLKKLYVPSSLL